MLYLRNANEQQSLGDTAKGARGRANLCCYPTLNSVTTSSLSLVNVNFTLGNYYFNCKNCVGTVIQVSENSGSTWISFPEGCEENQILPMPSQSAYYRAFTSCSVGYDPGQLTSSFSNEIFYVPNGYINYSFTQSKANAIFEITSGSTDVIYATQSVSSTQLAIPSASLMTSSLTPTEFFITGSTSMSLQITGSNINYYTSSCVATSSIFLGNWKLNPNEFYYITASISHRPENNCGINTLDFTPNSFNEANNTWYLANENGVFSGSATYGVITGSAWKTNVISGDCRYNTVYLSGSVQFVNPNISEEDRRAVYIAIASGSFTLSGNSSGNEWSMSVTSVSGSGSISAPGYYSGTSMTTTNSLIGLYIDSGSGATRPYNIYISGSQYALGDANLNSVDLGNTLKINGEGYIRSFGWGQGTTTQQTQYDCVFDTIPEGNNIYPIATDLFFYGDRKSYNSTASLWYDESGNGNNAVVTGSTLISSGSLGWIFNGTDNTLNWANGGFTTASCVSGGFTIQMTFQPDYSTVLTGSYNTTALWSQYSKYVGGEGKSGIYLNDGFDSSPSPTQTQGGQFNNPSYRSEFIYGIQEFIASGSITVAWTFYPSATPGEYAFDYYIPAIQSAPYTGISSGVVLPNNVTPTKTFGQTIYEKTGNDGLLDRNFTYFPFKGVVRDILIYKRQLTDAEIQWNLDALNRKNNSYGK